MGIYKKTMKLALIVISGLLCGVLSTKVRYDDYRVYRVTPKTESQMDDLRKLSELSEDFNFWTEVRAINIPVDIMVAPQQASDFEKFVVSSELDMEVFIENVQERIDNERASVHSRALDWVDYHPLEEIYEWLDDLAEEFPDTVTVVVGGTSYEGREIRGVRLSFSPDNVNNTVFLEGGNHARECIMKLTLVILAVLCGALASKVRYDNYTVYRVTPTTEAQVKTLRDLEDLNGGYSFWTQVQNINSPVDIMVPPHLSYDFQDFLSASQINSEVFIENVQEKIDNERPMSLSLSSPRAVEWTDYHTLTEIYDWLDSLAAEFPEVEVVVAGSTFEGREIKGVRVSFSAANADNIVFIEAGIHAREWITPATTTYILNEILRSDDPAIRAVAERYDWLIFPVFNPDGYEYTFTTDRMWRKTRTPYGSCFGADPNRNWGFQWNTGGASNNPCSETYAGPSAFSEVSTRTMSEYISSINDKITAYISFHSYSQLLMFPYGHTPQNLDNYQELQEVGDAAAEVLSQRYGTQYRVGNIAYTIYVASGGSVDWVKGTYGTRITYIYELRDLGRYGFLLPADQIIPTALETTDSLLAIMNGFDAIQ